MPVSVSVVMRGVSIEQYDQLRTEVGWLEKAPIGGILHVMWAEGDDLHGLDVWASEDAFEAFAQDHLGPALTKLGIAVQPEATFRSTHEVYVPKAVTLT
jgi:hypothetical protein